MDTLITLLTIYGVMFFIKDSHMTEWVRAPLERWRIFETFFGCAFCVGVHAGYAVWLAKWWALELPYEPREVIFWAVTWAFAGAAWCWLVEVVIEFLQSLGSVHEVLDMVRAMRLARLEQQALEACECDHGAAPPEEETAPQRPTFPPGQILHEGQVRRKPENGAG
jgi:hypothetical protein